MKIIYFFVLVFVFYFSYNIEQVSKTIHKNSLLKLSATPNENTISQCQVELQTLETELGKVENELKSRLEEWEEKCTGSDSQGDDILEEICKLLLEFIMNLITKQDDLKEKIDSKKSEIENMQSADN